MQTQSGGGGGSGTFIVSICCGLLPQLLPSAIRSSARASKWCELHSFTLQNSTIVHTGPQILIAAAATAAAVRTRALKYARCKKKKKMVKYEWRNGEKEQKKTAFHILNNISQNNNSTGKFDIRKAALVRWFVRFAAALDWIHADMQSLSGSAYGFRKKRRDDDQLCDRWENWLKRSNAKSLSSSDQLIHAMLQTAKLLLFIFRFSTLWSTAHRHHSTHTGQCTVTW